MAIPAGKVRASTRERRLVYHESPLVLFSARAKPLASPSSTSVAKPLQTDQPLPARHVTPSPTSRVGNEIAESMNRRSPVGKRQLFGSPHRTSSQGTKGRTGSTSGLERQHPESPIMSPGRRRLFASSLPEHVVDRSSGKASANGRDTSTESSALVRRGVEMPLFGIKSWGSVASINSTPVSPECSSSPILATRLQPPSNKQNSTKAAIPLELVSLLAPPVTTKKSAKRLAPATHQEVLRKAEARRKKWIPPRQLPPRQCKSRMSSVSLMEESDDDLYFDTIMHTAMSTVPDTVSTMKQVQSTPSPMAESDPTDTNVSRHNDNDQGEKLMNDQGKDIVVSPVRRKGAKPYKMKVDPKKRTRDKTSAIRKCPSTIGEKFSLSDHGSAPSTVVKRRRQHQNAVVATGGDSPPLNDKHIHSDRDEEAADSSSRPIVKVRTSTSRSAGRSTSRIHKVRFAPMTTTFSLEIRVKTSAQSRQGKREKVSRPTLSESTVQTIANEITQAYLAQEATAADESGEEQSAEEDSDTCSSSQDDPENLQTNDVRPHEKRGSRQQLKDAPAPRAPEVVLDDGHDARSIASEITMDIELLRGERDIAVPRATVMHRPVPCGDGVPMINDQDAGPQRKGDYDKDENIDDLRLPKRRRVETFTINGSTGANHSTTALKRSQRPRMMTNPSGGLLAGLPTCGDMTHSPQQRRRRWLRSTDSLAGCSLASLNSVKSFSERVPDKASIERVPGEVSVSTSRTEIHNEQINRKVKATVPHCHDAIVEPRRIRRFSGRCGKCSGCRLTFDCLSCKKCISNLQKGQRTDPGTGCLRRVCRVYCAQPTDTLARTVSTLDNLQPTSAVACLPYDEPIEDDGDASMSYLSDTGSVYSTASKMRRSRAARFWSRRWAEERKNKMVNVTAAEKNMKAFDDPFDGLAGNSKKRGRGKNAKSTLHDLELPMPTDVSVTSLLASRRSLRALMQYDEADQDWI